MTIIGVKDDGTQIILSSILTYLPEPDDIYVLIMKDETTTFVNEAEIKKEKQNADEFTARVLPRAISQNGKLKENISFSIKRVTVINIKILNFNDSIPHITSFQAIRNMSELFSLFDSQVIKYPNLTKTSVISDSYQVVGGLFDSSSIKRISSRADGSQDINLNKEGNENGSECNNNAENSNINNNIHAINNNDINENLINSSNNNTNINNNNINDNNNTNINSSNGSGVNSNNISNININNININSNNISNINSNNDSNINVNNTNINDNNNTNIINNNNTSIIDNNSNTNSNNNGMNNKNISAKSSISFNIGNNSNNKKSFDKSKVRKANSRKSIYDIKSLNPEQSVQFTSIILDSIYFAFNCISATEYVNNSYGTNYAIGVGISSGGPITAGTLGKEHIQFEIVGGALKESLLVSNSTETGMTLITEDTYKTLLDSSEAQNNLLFEKYKKIEGLHSKNIKTYIVKPSEALRPQVYGQENDFPLQDQLLHEEGINQNKEEEEVDDDLIVINEEAVSPNEEGQISEDVNINENVIIPNEEEQISEDINANDEIVNPNSEDQVSEEIIFNDDSANQNKEDRDSEIILSNDDDQVEGANLNEKAANPNGKEQND